MYKLFTLLVVSIINIGSSFSCSENMKLDEPSYSPPKNNTLDKRLINLPYKLQQMIRFFLDPLLDKTHHTSRDMFKFTITLSATDIPKVGLRSLQDTCTSNPEITKNRPRYPTGITINYKKHSSQKLTSINSYVWFVFVHRVLNLTLNRLPYIEYTSIRKLHIDSSGDKKITPAHKLFEVLQKSNVTNLDLFKGLRGNVFKEFDQLSCIFKIENLNLSSNNIDNQIMKDFCIFAQRMPHLRTLDLCCNNINRQGISHLSVLSQYMPHLSALELFHNPIDDQSMVLLANTFKQLKNLRRFSLSGTKCVDSNNGMNHLCDALLEYPNIEEIEFFEFKKNALDVIYLLKIAKDMPHLNKLILINCDIDNNVLTDMGKIIANMKNIKTINLQSNIDVDNANNVKIFLNDIKGSSINHIILSKYGNISNIRELRSNYPGIHIDLGI